MDLVKKGFVLWFTGLSGSGKSTLSARLAANLGVSGARVELLDGDEVRTHLSAGLTFSRADRDINVQRIGWVARKLAGHGVISITAAISPYRAIRDSERRAAETAGVGFCEVYMECPLEVVAARDVKGLYARALRGEIENFTGVSDPYEPPLEPEVVVHTDRESIEVGARRVIARLVELGYLDERALDEVPC